MAALSEVPPGRMVEKQILARRVAVINYGGRIIGFQSECAHMRASLAKGEIVDGVLTCPWHGWQYDIESGECLTVAGHRLKQFRVEVDEEDVYLCL
jgi:nitrite reductase/ring-hydroxylating ferredoxin subunit